MDSKFFVASVFSLVALAALTACGGGDGGGSTTITPPPNTVPRFAYAANFLDNTVSIFTVNAATGEPSWALPFLAQFWTGVFLGWRRPCHMAEWGEFAALARHPVRQAGAAGQENGQMRPGPKSIMQLEPTLVVIGN